MELRILMLQKKETLNNVVMKKLYLFAFIGLFASNESFGQEKMNSLSNISPRLKTVLNSYVANGENAFKTNAFRHTPITNLPHGEKEKFSVLIKGDGNLSSHLQQFGIKVNSQVGDIYSLRVSMSELAKIVSMPGIQRIEECIVGKPKLKNARGYTKVTQVHAGTGLKKGYRGDGVIVGVIDYGLDFTHPMFYTADGQSTRIARVWITGDNSGTPPSGFTYGTELKTVTEMATTKTSSAEASHGSHVTGIAAGSAYEKESDYAGVATNANIVFVESSGNYADELNYIFNYAKSVGKPAVVNMSLGSHIGPHDGTSLNDQIIDNLAKEGQIIVGAIGNEGATPLHIKHDFTPGDTVWTFPELADAGETTIDIWGEKNTDFEVAFGIADVTAENVVFESMYFSTSNPGLFDTVVVSGTDSIYFSLSGETSSLNQKTHASLYIQSNTLNYAPILAVAAYSGTVHAWNHGTGNGVPFKDAIAASPWSGFVNGDVKTTVGEIGGTAKNIISVGSYTSTNTFTSIITGVPTTTTEPVGQIAEYSSQGPTVDGRVVPTITGPGNWVISAVNSYHSEYLPGGGSEDHLVDSTMDGSDYWYYGAQSGTSMATPMVAGIVALMLEINPKLTPDGVKKLLRDKALTDSFTGTIPAGGSNVWGHGKVDALAIITQLEADVKPVDPTSIKEMEASNGLTVYPVPASDRLTVRAVANIQSLKVLSLDGKSQEVSFELDGTNQTEIDIENLNSGIYFLNVSTESNKEVIRFIKK